MSEQPTKLAADKALLKIIDATQEAASLLRELMRTGTAMQL